MDDDVEQRIHDLEKIQASLESQVRPQPSSCFCGRPVPASFLTLQGAIHTPSLLSSAEPLTARPSMNLWCLTGSSPPGVLVCHGKECGSVSASLA